MNIGRRGEDLACAFLQKHGYRIIGRNIRYRTGEIDIVAFNNGTFCFIEVKTRRSSTYGNVHYTFTRHKRERFLKAVHMYVIENDISAEISVDFIAISILGYNARITHYKQCEFFEN